MKHKLSDLIKFLQTDEGKDCVNKLDDKKICLYEIISNGEKIEKAVESLNSSLDYIKFKVDEYNAETNPFKTIVSFVLK